MSGYQVEDSVPVIPVLNVVGSLELASHSICRRHFRVQGAIKLFSSRDAFYSTVNHATLKAATIEQYMILLNAMKAQ